MNQVDFNFFETIIAFNCLKNETYMASIIDYIKPEYFNNKKINSVLTIICDFYRQRASVPSLTEIKARLTTPEIKRDYIEVVNSFKSLDPVNNLDELLHNTENFLKQKAIYNAILQSAEKIGENNVNADETLKIFEDACSINLFQDFGIDLISEIDKFVDKINITNEFFTTGYSWLDEKLSGGWAKGGKALYVVAAATNVGKSIMLTNLACNTARQNKNVLIISLEMSEEVYGKRAAATFSGIAVNQLQEKSNTLADSMKTFQKNNPNASLRIKEFPTKGISVAGINAYLKKIIETRKFIPDLIVIDYLNLIKPSVSKGNSYEDVKLIAEELRGISYKYGGIPILSATQINRSGYGEENPGLETTSESMGLSMTADVQIVMWATAEEKEMGYINIGMQKNRFGANFGTTKFAIDWKTLTLTELENAVADSSLDGTKSILDNLI